MKIELLCNDGSPMGITPPDIEERGVGGAELSMMTLMRTLAERGHEVKVFNNPQTPGVYHGVEYLNNSEYQNRTPKDVVILFRSPNARYNPGHMPPETRKIWWSTDQYTVGDYRALAHMVDFVVTISEHHTDFHRQRYGIDRKKMAHIDLGVRVQEYDVAVARIPRSAIFCSIPDRGLNVLHAAWPAVRKEVPDATLTITSDYRLWGAPDARNQAHRLMWASVDGVEFKGRVKRSELVRLQCSADILAYPCTYDELFCISAAECQVAGAVPVTSVAGALKMTNEWGVMIPGDPRSPDFVRRFSERIISLFSRESNYLEERRAAMMAGARLRFDWNRIAERWETLFEEGRL